MCSLMAPAGTTATASDDEDAEEPESENGFRLLTDERALRDEDDPFLDDTDLDDTDDVDRADEDRALRDDDDRERTDDERADRTEDLDDELPPEPPSSSVPPQAANVRTATQLSARKPRETRM